MLSVLSKKTPRAAARGWSRGGGGHHRKVSIAPEGSATNGPTVAAVTSNGTAAANESSSLNQKCSAVSLARQ